MSGRALRNAALSLAGVWLVSACASAPRPTAAPPAPLGHRPRQTVVAAVPLSATTGAPMDSAPTWSVVENPNARYIAALGMPTAKHDAVRPEHLAMARAEAAKVLQSYPDVEVAPAHFDRNALLAQSEKRKLLGVFFEFGVVHHSVDARGTRFEVNVAVVDLRTEDIVATLEGGATAPGVAGPEAEQLALGGALEGAMRAVPKLLTALEGTLTGPGT
jgi:hypothetical protein